MCEAGWQSFFFLPWKRKNIYYGGKNMAKINSQGKNMGERLRFPYPEGRDLITWRTGEAEINSLVEKYDMCWGTP